MSVLLIAGNGGKIEIPGITEVKIDVETIKTFDEDMFDICTGSFSLNNTFFDLQPLFPNNWRRMHGLPLIRRVAGQKHQRKWG